MENAEAGFLPFPGPLQRLRFPAGIRIDSGVDEGGKSPRTTKSGHRHVSA
jgi:acetyl/propionyl-CoA carboxylase alpha subunit